MAIYLGSSGCIQLLRTAGNDFRAQVSPSDVNVADRRFSFDFPSGIFITGDKLTIRRVNADGSLSLALLDFVDSSGWKDQTQKADGSWYVNVDPVGGIKLYSSWSDALAGRTSNAVPLRVPSSSYWLSIELAAETYHCVGQITEYTFSTARQAVNVSALGDAFEQRWSGLISGSGDMECFWDWTHVSCGGISKDEETAHYLHQLILRQQLGSEFKAHLIIKGDGSGPLDKTLEGADARAALFYEITAVVTNAALEFSPTEPVKSKINFVTTGPVYLRHELPAIARILQESGDLILNENGISAMLTEAF